MKVTISKILNKTDLAQSGSHGGLVVTRSEQDAIKDFFEGAGQDRHFVDSIDDEVFAIHYQDYTSNGTTPNDRVTPIGRYATKYNLQPGDVLVFERTDTETTKQYVIEYARRLSSAFFAGKSRTTLDVLNVDQLIALLSKYINEGVITRISSVECEMPVTYLGIKGILTIRQNGEDYELEVNGEPISENKKYFELDTTASPFVLKRTGTWSVSVLADTYMSEINEEADDELIADLKDFQAITDIDYCPVPEEKAPKIEHKGKMIPARNRQKAQNALALAGYKCELGEHETFIRKSNSLPYTEPHHLIPLQYDDLFEKSLDVEANIVSLCSTCHNKIHYGLSSENIIRELWVMRKDQLRAAGLGELKNGVELTAEILLGFYDA